ncbi:hypothetical protein ACQCT6_02845 [Cytobacillus gottheilii]|uniref:hypothetical protein n=1 Tax=Cytobacillus gottheilii TaxID=859144 RepID=UPI003CF4D163
MEFQKEYETLESINSEEILEIAFTFNSHRIKVFFFQKENNKFLTLVCENDQFSFVKNYGVYFTNGKAHINGYWGDYHRYAKGLANSETFKFNEFYDKLRQAINSIQEQNEEFTISFHNEKEGIQKIKSASDDSVAPNKAIYFNHIRRVTMSPAQYKKVSGILGKDAADYLKKQNLNAVFTTDITKQKSFILLPNETNK